MEVITSYALPAAISQLLSSSEIRELSQANTSTYNLEFDFIENYDGFDDFKNMYEYELPNDVNLFFMFKNNSFKYADMVNINKTAGHAQYEIFVTFSHETWPYPINLKHFVTAFITECIKKELDLSIELSEQYGFYLKLHLTTNTEQTIATTIEQVSSYLEDIKTQLVNSKTFEYEMTMAKLQASAG